MAGGHDRYIMGSVVESVDKYVSPLFLLCFNFDNVDSTVANMSPEEVPFNLKKIGAVAVMVILMLNFLITRQNSVALIIPE